MIRRLVPLALVAVVLYGVAPAILEVLGAYKRLRDVDPAWWIAVVATSAAGNLCMCSAAAAALQARVLAQAGLAPAAIGTGLTAGALLLLAALAGLPLLALPALLFGRHIPDGLLATGAIALGIFSALFGVGMMLLLNDRVLNAVARTLQSAESRVRRWRAASDELPERLMYERNLLRTSLGGAWPQAVATAAGRWIFDFGCLYAALLAVGARPPLIVALLAYCAAQLLGQLPLTPGGLGVVEAGLTGTLAIAGVPAAPAALATLAYRLASFWLPLPAGLIAWTWHRRRYGTGSA